MYNTGPSSQSAAIEIFDIDNKNIKKYVFNILNWPKIIVVFSENKFLMLLRN